VNLIFYQYSPIRLRDESQRLKNLRSKRLEKTSARV
jgi:hypothetical protein